MHRVGDDGCYRELTAAPVLVQEGANPWSEQWRVDDAVVGGYTLMHQRGYGQHADGRWSRPRGGGSTNSLPDET